MESKLEEIIFKVPEDNRIKGDNCPICGGETRFAPIPCPDGRPGCLVLHQAFVCQKCGKAFLSRGKNNDK